MANDAGRDLARERGCLNCHDPSGQSRHPGAPFIAGQKKKYLIKQIESFQRVTPQPDTFNKILERSHPAMNSRSQALNKRETALVADFFSRQRCPVSPRQAGGPAGLPEKGKRCVFCHDDTGINPFSLYPNIAGQNERYLIAQLRAFRRSARDGADHGVKDKRFHRMMAPVVLDLTDPEIEALAAYFSRLPCRTN